MQTEGKTGEAGNEAKAYASLNLSLWSNLTHTVPQTRTLSWKEAFVIGRSKVKFKKKM